MGQIALIVVLDDGDDDMPGRTATVYEVDLEAEEGTELREVLRERSRDDKAATVRKWAQSRNLPVSNHGRIPLEIRRQFERDQRVQLPGVTSAAGNVTGADGASESDKNDDDGSL